MCVVSDVISRYANDYCVNMRAVVNHHTQVNLIATQIHPQLRKHPTMTFLEAANAVLSEAGTPLHYQEIFDRALALGIIETNGVTPQTTMASRLYTVTKQEGSGFERHGKGVFGLTQKKKGGVETLVAETNEHTRAQLRALLAQVPPKRFEALIMDLLLEMGFDEATLAVTPYVKDGGIDVKGTYSTAGLAQVNAAVQVKRWKNNIQSQTVTQLRGSLQVHQFGIIITTSDYTKSARQEAEAPGKSRISLIDGEQLIELLLKHHIGVVDQSFIVKQLDAEWWGEVIEVQTRETANDEIEVTPVKDVVDKRAVKPVSVTILGRNVDVRTWKDVLCAVAEELAEAHPTEFAEIATSLHGVKRRYIAYDASTMISPAAIGVTGLWLECNQSAVTVQKLSLMLLEAFGHHDAELQIRTDQE